MKKTLLFLLMVFVATLASGQEITVIATNNGIAPVPAFTLGKPAGLVLMRMNLTKHLEFAPDINFSLEDGKLWFADLWLKYSFNLDSAKKWTAVVGIDFPSQVGQAFTFDGERIHQSVVYGILKSSLNYAINENNSVMLDYWYTYTSKLKYGVKGSYLSLLYTWKKPFKKFTIASNLNLFYINYSDGAKGLSGSVTTKLTHTKTGLFISTQEMSPLIAQKVNTEWNVSFGITRKVF